METTHFFSFCSMGRVREKTVTRKVSPVVLVLAGALLTLQLLTNLQNVTALNNGVAMKPPMGWLNWERFTCQIDCLNHPNDCISEHLFMSMAERLIQDGYVDVGYKYVNIDDCWQEKVRDTSSQRLVANSTRFPNGLTYLADYMHERNLKLGLYGDCGYSTCAGYPAQLKPNASSGTEKEDNYFKLDAHTLADWKIDSFKMDGCHIDPQKAEQICPFMSEALSRATASSANKQPILLICEWPFYMMYAHLKPNYTLAAESCNVWRYYDDIEDSWLSIMNTVDYTVKHQSTIVKYHGPGHWFDPDQLVIGNFGLSLEQAKAQMALWSIWSAPLYMSNDLRQMKPEFANILKNRHLINVNQDSMGVLGLMVASASNGTQQVFVKPILPIRNSCPSFAIVYLNRNTLGNRQKVSFKLGDLLLAAPIYQAAKHLDEIQWNHSLELESGSIDAKECIRRLSGSRNEEDEEDEDDQLEQFEVFDLFHDNQSLGFLTLDSKLELLVAPNGVRAVRLEAKQVNGEGDS